MSEQDPKQAAREWILSGSCDPTRNDTMPLCSYHHELKCQESVSVIEKSAYTHAVSQWDYFVEETMKARADRDRLAGELEVAKAKIEWCTSSPMFTVHKALKQELVEARQDRDSWKNSHEVLLDADNGLVDKLVKERDALKAELESCNQAGAKLFKVTHEIRKERDEALAERDALKESLSDAVCARDQWRKADKENTKLREALEVVIDVLEDDYFENWEQAVAKAKAALSTESGE